MHKISIVPRGQALGYVMNLPDEDSYLKTREELIDQMTVLLGGRVAEQIVFGAVTTGAANDLQRVAEITHAMVHDYGMGTSGDAPQAVARRPAQLSDLTRRIRDEEQQELAFEAHRGAWDLITDAPRSSRTLRRASCSSTRCSSAPRSTGSWRACRASSAARAAAARRCASAGAGDQPTPAAAAVG